MPARTVTMNLPVAAEWRGVRHFGDDALEQKIRGGEPAPSASSGNLAQLMNSEPIRRPKSNDIV